MTLKVGDIMMLVDGIADVRYKIIAIGNERGPDQIKWEWVNSNGEKGDIWALDVDYIIRAVNNGRMIIISKPHIVPEEYISKFNFIK